MSTIRSVCVFCGSSPGRNARFLPAGMELGQKLAEADLRLVYGGGTRGIMGAVARGALDAGGRVVGIIPEFLLDKEANNQKFAGLDELIVTRNMHERKHAMFEKSDAFVALPGGIGTVEEIVEIMTWGQLDRHRKPIIFANIDGFWDPMLAMVDHMRDEGFIHSSHRVQPGVVDEISGIIPAIFTIADAVDLAPNR